MWVSLYTSALQNLLNAMPKNLAGIWRDGELSQCFVFFRFEDRTKHLQMISSLPDAEHRKLKLTELHDVVKLCIQP